jgi:two-component system chemotaxis response regulator CheB
MKRPKPALVKRDLVIIGSSAGGLPALMEIMGGLPADFPAAIFVVQHIPPYTISNLHHILNRVGPLQAVSAVDGDMIEPGKIYVATPDHHLMVEHDKVIVKRGPKENRFRPSIDALFRSAAYTYGSRVIGVVLSGVLDDGTSGLWSVKRLGGLTVIQEPADALFPQMPLNAQEYVDIDYTVPAGQMAALLCELTTNVPGKKPKLSPKELKLLETEIVIAGRENAFEIGIIEMGTLTPFTCPECHGALTELKEGKIIRFRCHTGHAYTISALLSEVSTNVEAILWQAMQGLEETTMLLMRLSQHFDKNAQTDIAQLFLKKAHSIKAHSQAVHNSVLAHELISGDIGLKPKIPYNQ